MASFLPPSVAFSISDGNATAAVDIPAGTVVCVAVPLACVAAPEGTDRVCAHCFIRPKGNARLLNCSGCTTPYCSKECQKAAWPQHKPECKHLLLLSSLLKGDEPHALLLARLYRAAPSTANDFSSASPLSQQALLRSSVERAAALGPFAVDESGRLASAVAALRASQLIPDAFAQPDALALTAAARASTLPVTDSVLRRVGCAVIPAALAPVFGHSCAPNCAVAWVPGSSLTADPELAPALAADPALGTAEHALVLRTIAPVAAGTPLVHSYVDPTLPRAKRHALLSERYLGVLPPTGRGSGGCACAACSSGNAEDYGPAPPPLPESEGGDGAAEELRLLLEARDKASACAFSPRDPEPARILAALAELGYKPPPPPSAAALRAASAAGGASDLSQSMRDAVLLREASILRFVLARLVRFRPPFHADVMRVVDQLYAELMLLGQAGLAVPIAQHQVAFYTHACRWCPGHPALALQVYALADLYFNVATTRMEREAEAAASSAAATSDPASPQQERLDSHAQLVAALQRDPHAPTFDAEFGGGDRGVEVLLQEAVRLYSICVPSLTVALGAQHSLVKLATSRYDMLRELTEHMIQEWGTAGAAAPEPTSAH